MMGQLSLSISTAEQFFQRPMHLSLAIMRSSTKPTSAEAILLRKHISIAVDCEERVEEQITLVRTEAKLAGRPSSDIAQNLAELSYIRREFAAMAQIHRNALTSIAARTIPGEILSLIFLEFMPSYPMSYPMVYRQNHYWTPDTPWTLCMVCKRWRDVALSTPALWSCCHVVLGSNELENDEARERAMFLLDTLLQRSGNHPLSLQISLSYDSIRRFSGARLKSHPILDRLCAESRRWSQVALAIPAQLLHTVQHSVRGCVPLLQALQLDISGQADVPFDLFEVAPLLRRVALTVTHSKTQSMILLPWRQVKVIEALTIDDASVPGLFECHSALERARLHYVGSLTSRVDDPVLFERLQAVSLSGSCHILLDIHAPSLTSLHLFSIHIDRELVSVFAHLNCSLQILCLDSVDSRADEIAEIFTFTPFLLTLEFRGMDEALVDQLLQLLSYSTKGSTLLSRLQHFALFIRDADIISPSVLEFLGSRSPDSSHLSGTLRALSSAHIDIGLGAHTISLGHSDRVVSFNLKDRELPDYIWI